MKRFAAAALLAAVMTPPVAGAEPLGSDKACGVGMAQGGGTSSCRFTASADTLGLIGFTTDGWTLTHKVRTSACVDHVYVHTTTVVEDFDEGAGPVGEQTSLTAGVVYTLSLKGNGLILAGGPSDGAPSPTASEPEDAVVDNTGGTVAGATC